MNDNGSMFWSVSCGRSGCFPTTCRFSGMRIDHTYYIYTKRVDYQRKDLLNRYGVVRERFANLLTQLANFAPFRDRILFTGEQKKTPNNENNRYTF